MSQIGVAIWGAGWVAGEHARAYMHNPNTEVVAVGSRTKEGARRKAEEWGLPGAQIHDDLEQLLASPDVDLVSVCTPNSRHAAEVVTIAEAGKHILIEKPPATDLEGLKAMRDAVRSAGVLTHVSFVLHWHPLLQAVKRTVANGTLGDIMLARMDYWHRLTKEDEVPLFSWLVDKDKAGSVFLAGGSHPMDSVRWLIDDEVDEVFGYSGEPTDDYNHATTTMGLFRFKRGAIAEISACLGAYVPYTFNIDLLGSDGTLRDERIYARSVGTGKEWTDLGVARPDDGDVSAHPFQAQINYFVDCIQRGEDSSINLEDGVKTTEACLAVDMSAATGKPVRLPLI